MISHMTRAHMLSHDTVFTHRKRLVYSFSCVLLLEILQFRKYRNLGNIYKIGICD